MDVHGALSLRSWKIRQVPGNLELINYGHFRYGAGKWIRSDDLLESLQVCANLAFDALRHRRGVEKFLDGLFFALASSLMSWRVLQRRISSSESIRLRHAALRRSQKPPSFTLSMFQAIWSS